MPTIISGDGTITGLTATGISSVQNVGRANLPVGSVLQVVQGTYSTNATTTSAGTMVDTGLSASITPTSSSSKVLVVINQNGVYRTGSIYAMIDMRLVRGSTAIQTICASAFWNGNFPDLTSSYGASISTAYLDSPATTSSTTYKTQYQIPSGLNGTIGAQYGSSVSTITLMEIAA
jgi:hypothetical protein